LLQIRILRTLDHPHIVKMHADIRGQEGMYYIVMERVEGGELFDRVVELEVNSQAPWNMSVSTRNITAPHLCLLFSNAHRILSLTLRSKHGPPPLFCSMLSVTSTRREFAIEVAKADSNLFNFIRFLCANSSVF
jgi:hypothetical protein